MRLGVNCAFLAATATGSVKMALMKGQKEDHCHHGIRSVSSASYQANSPIEDRIEICMAPNPNEITSITVLDGHGGWQVAEFAKIRISKLLNNIFALDNSDTCDIDSMIKKVFIDLDEAYIQSIKHSFELGFGEVARVGACCISVIFNPDGKIICGNAGDCRAVLGRRASLQVGSLTGIFAENDRLIENEKFEAINLSNDHNAKLDLEKTRLKEAHPDESLSELVQCYGANACYVKGRLQPTRCLGDLYLKRRDFNGPPPSCQDPNMSRGAHIGKPYNPPYITCTPEVTIRSRNEEDDRFVIIASDGLWDVMSSKEAVDFVGSLYHTSSSNNPRARWWNKKESCSPAQMVVDEALRRVSNEYGMSVNELGRIPPGNMRRQRHDDISVVVVFLK